MTELARPQINYSWVIASSCFTIQAIGVGTYVSFGVFFNSLTVEFEWSRAAISGASSVGYLLMGLLGIFVGKLNDSIGPRILMTVTGLLMATGLVLMASVRSIWQLYLFYGVLVGMGLSSIDVIALSTVARWFTKTRGLVTGIVKIGTGVGQLSLPLIAGFLIAGVGWRSAYVALGVGVGIILISIAQLLRRDPGVSSQRAVPEAKADTEQIGLALHQARRTVTFWLLCAMNLLIVYCFMTVIVHIVPYVQDTGVTAPEAASVLAFVGGVSMFGRFAIGILIDRIGSVRAMQISLLLLIVALLWLQLAEGLRTFYLLASFYGLAHGSFFTAISPMVAELFGVRAHGAIFGLVAFFGTLGGAAGPVLAGFVFDRTGEYDIAFWICTSMSSIGLILVSRIGRHGKGLIRGG